jgi:cytochrome oxidase assembly protein ShyY1
MKTVVIYVVSAILIASASFGCWKIERWINWKLDYGDKVEQRIEILEARIDVLESRN